MRVIESCTYSHCRDFLQPLHFLKKALLIAFPRYFQLERNVCNTPILNHALVVLSARREHERFIDKKTRRQGVD